ncbi:hypothetical protein BH10ACT1_BH10ACT1_34420 [soil metagenome]
MRDVQIRPTVCLNMIVRDEAHVVAEALACVAPHIDRWVIVDTGSVDDTIEVIRSFFAERGIPGELHERPWVDFGTNRTEALELAAGQADYTWVIDADDLVAGDLDLTELEADAYTLRYGKEGFTFWRTQIFRSALPWRFVGVVHEYPTCDAEPCRIERLDGDHHLIWRSIGGRNVAGDKFERDAALLRAVVEADPSDARATFYLAQSLKDGGHPEEAVARYERRIALGGWDEEVFYSLLQRARCLDDLGTPWPEVQDAFLRAWAFRPTRGEPLLELARHHRLAGDFTTGRHFARIGAELAMPDDLLFLSADAHLWGLLDEQAISAHHAGHLDEALELGTRLLTEGHLPEAERPRVARNREFAVASLAPSRLEHRPDLVAGVAERVASGTPYDVTLTITTGRRLDLFEQTLDSFLACCEDRDRIGRWIAVDERSSAADRRTMAERYPFLEIIAKDPDDARHPRSMNLLRDAVATPWWLHLEDDWHFVTQAPYVQQAVDILEDDPEVGQVLFNRAYAETFEDRDLLGGDIATTRTGQRHWRQRHLDGSAWDDHLASLPAGGRTSAWWPGYSLRPSVVRTSAVAGLGPYDESAPHFELDFAHRWAAAGLVTAAFDDITCLHLGPLTSERGVHRTANAYDLAGQPQFDGEPSFGAAVRVINLDRRPDRLAAFDRRLQAAGAHDLVERCRRFAAIDGEALELTDELAHLFRGNDHGFRRGVIGCALSHLGLWEEAAAADRPFVVFEDDAVPLPGFTERISGVLAELASLDDDGSAPDLILLGRSRRGSATLQDELRTLAGGLDPIDWDDYLGGTFGYVVTPSGARCLLSLVERDGVAQAIDAFLAAHAGALDVRRSRPDVVTSTQAWPLAHGDSDVQHDLAPLAPHRSGPSADG